ncbi:hypothetical protein Tco_0335312 [Tanacetum coccineum]
MIQVKLLRVTSHYFFHVLWVQACRISAATHLRCLLLLGGPENVCIGGRNNLFRFDRPDRSCPNTVQWKSKEEEGEQSEYPSSQALEKDHTILLPVLVERPLLSRQLIPTSFPFEVRWYTDAATFIELFCSWRIGVLLLRRMRRRIALLRLKGEMGGDCSSRSGDRGGCPVFMSGFCFDRGRFSAEEHVFYHHTAIHDFKEMRKLSKKSRAPVSRHSGYTPWAVPWYSVCMDGLEAGEAHGGLDLPSGKFVEVQKRCRDG